MMGKPTLILQLHLGSHLSRFVGRQGRIMPVHLAGAFQFCVQILATSTISATSIALRPEANPDTDPFNNEWETC